MASVLLRLLASAAGPLLPGAPPLAAVQNWTTYSLAAVDAQAVCINGLAATLNAFVNPLPSTTWVINIGGVSPQSPGFCVNLQNCLVFGELNGTSAKPAPTPPPTPIGFGETLLGSNCSQNPDFCSVSTSPALGLGPPHANAMIILCCSAPSFNGYGCGQDTPALEVTRLCAKWSDPDTLSRLQLRLPAAHT